jgi:hypothetical protein
MMMAQEFRIPTIPIMQITNHIRFSFVIMVVPHVPLPVKLVIVA